MGPSCLRQQTDAPAHSYASTGADSRSVSGDATPPNGVAERANEDARRFAAAKLLGATNVDERDAMMAMAKKVYN